MVQDSKNESTGDRGGSDKDGVRLDTLVAFVIVIVLIFVVANSVVTAMEEQAEELDETCDQKYGDDNWTLVPANSSEWDPTFIGDQYVCVAENSTRAQRDR